MPDLTLPLPGAGVPSRRWRTVAIGTALFTALLGTALIAFPSAQGASAPPAPAAGGAIDPRLIIHARTVPIAGLLTGGMRVTGTLYPALPGRNTVRVLIQGRTRRPGGRGELVAAMPGMVMTPARATLIARDGVYSGVLTLPMFGRYRAGVALDTLSGRVVGTLTLALDLPNV